MLVNQAKAFIAAAKQGHLQRAADGAARCGTPGGRFGCRERGGDVRAGRLDGEVCPNTSVFVRRCHLDAAVVLALAALWYVWLRRARRQQSKWWCSCFCAAVALARR